MSPLLPSYIQKGTDARKNLEATYGILIKSIPFKPFPELKDLPVRDWADEQGDDEYIPDNPVFKAYEDTIELIYKGLPNTARQMIYSMLQYVQGGEFSIFDTFTQRGLRCRYVGYSDEAYYNKEKQVIDFTLKVKVNNPLSYGILLSVGTFGAYCECDLTAYWSDGTSETHLTGDSLTKEIVQGDNNQFVIIVPNKVNTITSFDWADNKTRLDSQGYLRVLSYTGVRYIQGD